MEVHLWHKHSQILPQLAESITSPLFTSKSDKFNSGFWRNKSGFKPELTGTPGPFNVNLTH